MKNLILILFSMMILSCGQNQAKEGEVKKEIRVYESDLTSFMYNQALKINFQPFHFATKLEDYSKERISKEQLKFQASLLSQNERDFWVRVIETHYTKKISNELMPIITIFNK